MKRLCIIFALASLSLCLWAQPISEQQARSRAQQWLSAKGTAKARSQQAETVPILTSAKVEANNIYAFNCEGGGYLIASADARTRPVLGYSDTGRIDWDLIPDNMRSWLRTYDETIRLLGDRSDFASGNDTQPQKPAVVPLVYTQWHQVYPYYLQSPSYEGTSPKWEGKAPLTGCVATSMAQIMNYYQWPRTATPEIPAYSFTTTDDNEKEEWSIDALPPVTFDWANMLDTYDENPELTRDTEAQQQAVATLMRYCGQSVMTQYMPGASASNAESAVSAFIKYFCYSPRMQLAIHREYSIDQWEDLIYDEVAAGRPVFYAGNTGVEGHAFICDGYEDGLFHVNWGWGGSCDGYYALSVVNPYVSSNPEIASTGIGFCISQHAIIGIEPAPEGTLPTDIVPYTILSSLKCEENNVIGFEYAYISATTEVEAGIADYAVGTQSNDGTLEPLFLGDPADSIVYYGNYCPVEIDTTLFEPGESVRLYPMINFRSAPNPEGWQLIGKGLHYIRAGRTIDGQFQMGSDHPELSIVSTNIVRGSLKADERCDLTLTLCNASNIEYIDEIRLHPYYYGDITAADITPDTPFEEGDMLRCGAYLRAGQDSEVTFVIKPKQGGCLVFELTTNENKPIGRFFLDVPLATAIKTVAAESDTDDTWHTLSGLRLSGKPTRKGLYLNNGHKVLIK